MEERILDSQHRSDLSSLELRRRRLPRQRLRSSPEVFRNETRGSADRVCETALPSNGRKADFLASEQERRSTLRRHMRVAGWRAIHIYGYGVSRQLDMLAKIAVENGT